MKKMNLEEMHLQEIKKQYVDQDPSLKADVALRRLCTAVSSKIHNARVKAGLSQKELAEKMGTHQPAINRIENESNHSLRTIVRCADALDLKVSIVFTPVNNNSWLANDNIAGRVGVTVAKMKYDYDYRSRKRRSA